MTQPKCPHLQKTENLTVIKKNISKVQLFVLILLYTSFNSAHKFVGGLYFKYGIVQPVFEGRVQILHHSGALYCWIILEYCKISKKRADKYL